MNLQPITLDLREPIEMLRHRYQHTLSSHAFPSLYLWREFMELSVMLTTELYAVKSGWRGENSWFFPCGNPEAVLGFIAQKRKEPNFLLYYLRQEDARFLEEQFPGQWHLARDPASDEYLYDRTGHFSLKGGAYAKLRTQVHKVEREYSPHSEPIHDQNLDHALEIIRAWKERYCLPEPSVLAGSCVDEQALLLHHELGIAGTLLYLDGVPAAVTSGFAISDDTFDIVSAKSISRKQGVPYYAKRELFKQLSCPWINIEEDLGIAGLRNMKQGMNPVAKNEIWEAKPL